MGDPYQIANMAQRVPLGRNAEVLAVAICALRDQDPFSQTNVLGLWMPRWQAVVAESLMLDAIRAEVLGNG